MWNFHSHSHMYRHRHIQTQTQKQTQVQTHLQTEQGILNPDLTRCSSNCSARHTLINKRSKRLEERFCSSKWSRCWSPFLLRFGHGPCGAAFTGVCGGATPAHSALSQLYWEPLPFGIQTMVWWRTLNLTSITQAIDLLMVINVIKNCMPLTCFYATTRVWQKTANDH